MSRLRQTFPPEFANSMPWFNRRGALAFVEGRLSKFEKSAHPDDREIARIVRSLPAIPMDDYIHLVKSLREPGSANAPNRPAGKAPIRAQRLEFLLALKEKLGRKPKTSDVERAAPNSPGTAGDASKRRELMKLLPLLGE
jgi:hypothetical protein